MPYSYNLTTKDRDRDDSYNGFVTLLEFKGSRQRSVWMSVVVHGALLTALLIIPLVFTDAIKLKYDTVLIAPPPPERQILEVTPYRQPPPPKVQPPKEKPIVAPPPVKPVLVEPPKPKPPEEPPKVADLKLPEVIREKPKPTIKNTPRLESEGPDVPAPKLEVKTGAFSTGSSAKPTVNLPASQVQTGGFGDPNGIKGEGKPGKIANIASLGSFDLPAGPGAGNGTGGSRGVKGTVASSGFGNGVAPVGGGGGNGGGGSGRAVQQGGFSDNASATPEPARKRVETEAPTTPVEIVSKPKPDYTEAARKMKVEGEVLVRVVFAASGELRVLNIVRGLGHGLDESALRAAQQIKFKPAQRNGQPVDSTATVHIVFQLAY